MMDVTLECLYCGYKWERVVYSKAHLQEANCPKCKSTDPKITEKNVIDTYVGCPPFKE